MVKLRGYPCDDLIFPHRKIEIKNKNIFGYLSKKSLNSFIFVVFVLETAVILL